MTCDYCGGETKRRRVKNLLKGRLYVAENVPAEVCQECGERYFHATTLDALDQLLKGKHPVKRTLRVEVVSM